MNRKSFFRILSILLCIVTVTILAVPGNVSAKKKKPALNSKELVLLPKQKKTLKVKGVSKKKIKKITYVSKNKKIAKVSKKGKVTAVKPGQTKVICKVRLKNGRKYSLKCKVKVSHPLPHPLGSCVVTLPTAVPEVTPEVTPEATASTAPEVTASTAPEVTASTAPEVTASTAPEVTPEATPAPPKGTHYSKNGILTTDNGEMRSDMTAFQVQHDMGLGINLGNTMESCGTWINGSSVTDYEMAWGAPETTQEMISGMKRAGFSSLRIPVAWSNMMSTDGTYTIDEEYLNRVETIMNYAFREKMYVILNIHYDGGWWARFGSFDETEREQAMVKYKAIWTQLAERYQEYSDYLIFESANEEVGSRLNLKDDYAGSGYLSSEAEIAALANKINQTFVDVVRGTGGNNAKRYLLIAGYNTNIGMTCSSLFEMPKDTIEEHLMVSVHYYSPYGYCLVDNSSDANYIASWGTDGDIAAMKADLQNMKINFTNRGIPVVIGEYGIAAAGSSMGRKEGRDVFIRTICQYAVENGMCPVLWDTDDRKNSNKAWDIYDRESCSITNNLDWSAFREVVKLIENLPVYVPSGVTGSYVWNGLIGVSGWNPTSPVADEDCSFSMSGIGACYQIDGVDWSTMEHPVMILHAKDLSATPTYEIAREVNAENQYWKYIENADLKGNWKMSEDITIDLSELGLQKRQTLYLAIRGGTSFNGKVSITIQDLKTGGE